MIKHISKLIADQKIGLAIAMLSAALYLYISSAPWSSHVAMDGISIGFFPKIAVAILFALSVILVFFPNKKLITTKITLREVASIIAAFIIIMLFLFTFLRWGFEVAGSIFLTGGMFLLGLRPWYFAVLFGLIATAVIIIIFSLMGVSMPSYFIG